MTSFSPLPSSVPINAVTRELLRLPSLLTRKGDDRRRKLSMPRLKCGHEAPLWNFRDSLAAPITKWLCSRQNGSETPRRTPVISIALGGDIDGRICRFVKDVFLISFFFLFFFLSQGEENNVLEIEGGWAGLLASIGLLIGSVAELLISGYTCVTLTPKLCSCLRSSTSQADENDCVDGRLKTRNMVQQWVVAQNHVPKNQPIYVVQPVMPVHPLIRVSLLLESSEHRKRSSSCF